MSIYIKIIIRTLKRSIKDYLIYLFTIMLVSSTFFAFLTIASPNNPFQRSIDSNYFSISMLNVILTFSIYAISLIIFFLVVHVNKYIFNTRVKDLGLYMILGMKSYIVSLLFFAELFLMGMIGIFFGIFIGHILAVILTSLTFVMSGEAIRFYFSIYYDVTIATITFFGIILAIMGIVNVFKISKYSLSKLWSSERKNERTRFNKISVIISIPISIISAVTAYLIMNNLLTIGRAVNLVDTDINATFRSIMDHTITFYANPSNIFGMQVIALVSIFIFVFSIFYSISYILYIVRNRAKQTVYKNNNIVVIVNLLSKISSNVRTFGSITLCISIAFSVSAIMPGFMGLIEGFLQYRTLFDVQVMRNNFFASSLDEIYVVDFGFVNEILQSHGVEIQDNVQVEGFFISDSDFNTVETRVNNLDLPVLAMALSDYNELRSARGHDEIRLNDNEFIIHLDYEADYTVYLHNFRHGLPLELGNGITLFLSEEIVYNDPISPFIFNNSLRRELLVLPDNAINGLSIASTGYFVNTTYPISLYTAQQIRRDILNAYIYLYNLSDENIENIRTSDLILKIRIRAIEYGNISQMNLALRLISIYLPAVFMMVSLALITLTQLTDARENKEGFRNLFKLGVDKKGIYAIIYKQVGFFFAIPVIIGSILAIIIYYVVAVAMYGDRIQLYMGDSFIYSIMLSVSIFIITIIGYLVVAIKSYKNEISDIFSS